MIKIEKADVFGWESAIRGMRNPLNSWDKSDSEFFDVVDDISFQSYYTKSFKAGPNDLSLMKKLVNAGSDHSKFMRMINVTADVTAPLYWWKEYDTYKVGTVANSCSTMHKIHSEKITLDDFSFDGHEDLDFDDEVYVDDYGEYMKFDNLIVTLCEYLRMKYVNSNDKRYWRYLIQLLPSSYNQKRTIQLNYAVLRNIYHARRNHKLDEWHTFCEWIEKLPYSELITE